MLNVFCLKFFKMNKHFDKNYSYYNLVIGASFTVYIFCWSRHLRKTISVCILELLGIGQVSAYWLFVMSSLFNYSMIDGIADKLGVFRDDFQQSWELPKYVTVYSHALHCTQSHTHMYMYTHVHVQYTHVHVHAQSRVLLNISSEPMEDTRYLEFFMGS